jgi:ribosome-associated heat shock protein Hsp15
MAEGALRLDKYLWFSRLAKTRSAAQALCESRHLRLDGRVIERASASVKPGQVIVFPQGQRVRVLRVEKLPERRGPFTEAQKSYADLAPLAIDGPGHAGLAGAH